MALTKILQEGIKDGEIVNADINASAAIARTKLANVDLVDDTSPQLGGTLESNGQDIAFADNDKAIFGTGVDFEIYHKSADNGNYIESQNGRYLFVEQDQIFILNQAGNEYMIHAVANGATSLYYDNSKKLETGSTGVTVSGSLFANTGGGQSQLGTHLDLGDNQMARFGAGDDLQIYHNGTHSYALNSTGQFILGGDTVLIKDGANSEVGLKYVKDGAVELYYDDAKKFETRSNGILITSNGDAAINIQAPNDISQSRLLFSDQTNTDGVITYDHNERKLHLGAGTSTATDGDITIDSSGKLSTGGETSPDVVGGGLCLNTGAEDGIFFSCKNSDIAHGRTANDETDTLFSIRKISAANGGAEIRAYTDTAGTDPAITIFGTINSASDANSCPVIIKGARAASGSGVGTGGIPADRGVVRISNDGDNTVATFTGEGLCFHSDTAAANALDDYEEGTYTPTFDTGMSGISYSVQSGNYVKIGKLVRFDFYIQVNGGVSNGSIIAFTLPFTSAAGTNSHRGSGVITYHNINDGNSGSIGFPALYIGSTSAQCYMGGTQWTATSGSAQSSRYFIGGGTYHAA